MPSPLKPIIHAVYLAIALTALPTAAVAQQGVLFVEGDKVGIGVENPGPGILHLRNSGAPTSFEVETVNVTVPSTWYFQSNAVTGAFLISNFFGGGAQFQVFPNQPASTFVVRGGRVGIGTQNPAATLHVEGDIRQRTTVIHPDYVFEDEYQLESIEEHAELMWTNKYLPAVGPGQYDTNGTPYIDHAVRSQGMLEELEKAHIYIEQLRQQLQELQQRVQELESR